MGKIFTTAPDEADPGTLWAAVADLQEAAKDCDGARIRELIRGLVPEYSAGGKPAGAARE